MPRFDPLMVTEETAAGMFELPIETFRTFVQMGILPKGRELWPRVIRWDVAALRMVAAGERPPRGIQPAGF